jgi:hypothetical protein
MLNFCHTHGFQTYINPPPHKKGSRTTSNTTISHSDYSNMACCGDHKRDTCVQYKKPRDFAWNVRPNNGRCKSFPIPCVWRTEGANGITVYGDFFFRVQPALLKSVTRFMSPCKRKKMWPTALLGCTNVNNTHVKNKTSLFFCSHCRLFCSAKPVRL